jgi:hypothetical protein
MNTPETPDFRAVAADSIGKDLLSALIIELRLLPEPWPKLSKKKQDAIIERLRDRVKSNIEHAVVTLAAQGRTVVAGELDQITIKDGVKAVVKFGANSGNLNELYEAAGQAVLFVVANIEKHTEGMNEIQGEADQRAMDLGHEYDPNGDGKGMDDVILSIDPNDEIDAEPLAIEHQPLQEELDKAFEDGRLAAQDDGEATEEEA